MRIARVIVLVAVLAATLPGCRRAATDAGWLDAPQAIAAPSAAGGRFPHLARSDQTVVLSWLEPAEGGRFALRFSQLEPDGWTAPATVASGRDWFVNWADFPSVVPRDGQPWTAHWLEQRPGNVYSYDVRIATSSDGGRSWSPPFTPHADGTATEHGFVTLLPAGEATRAFWLDGRHTSAEHDHGGTAGGAMTLRSVEIGPQGALLPPDVEVDDRVCDCCQTDAAMTRDGPVLVYRDRSPDEIRDIAVVRLTAQGWSEPEHVSDDGWRIDACPVNGPAIDARGDDVVVAWYTAPDRPRVRLAFSSDGGRHFGPAIDVDAGRVVGRVDTVLLPDGRAAVSWIAESDDGAAILVRAFDRKGAAGVAVTVAHTDVARSSGFPQMILARGGLLFAWTAPGDVPEVRMALARLR